MENNDDEHIARQSILQTIDKNSSNSLWVSNVENVIDSAREHSPRSIDHHIWQTSLGNLISEGYGEVVKYLYGRTRKTVQLSHWSTSKDIVEKESYRRLKEKEGCVDECYQEVNTALRTIRRVRKRGQKYGLPTYKSSKREIEDLKQEYLIAMEGVVNEFLHMDPKIDANSVKTDRQNSEGPTVLRSDVPDYRVELSDTGDGELLEYKESIPPTETEKIKKKFSESPVAATEEDNIWEVPGTYVPSRTPGVLSVELLHELGHFVSDGIVTELVDESSAIQTPSNTSVLDYLFRCNMTDESPEKTANELAKATIARLQDEDQNKYALVSDGLESYILTAQYDFEIKGYGRYLSDVQGSQESIENVFRSISRDLEEV